MTENQQKQLESLIDKQVVYKSECYVLKSFKQVTATVILNTETKKIVLTVQEELPLFLKLNGFPVASPVNKTVHHPLVNQQTIQPEYSSVLVTPKTSAIETALLNVLAMIQEDDANIPKANAVCNVVDSAVKVERQKLEIQKYLDKKNER